MWRAPICHHDTHTPRELLVQAHSRISFSWNREDDRQLCVHAKKCQQFSTITDVAEERWRLLLTEINCPASASSLGNRPIILFVGQLDFTTVSKRSSWKSGHYNFNDKPTFIRVTLALACVFDSKFPSHKERDLKFFHGRLSLLTHPLPPPPLKKHGLLLCQEPPLRTDFEPGALSNSSFITLRRSIMTVKLVSCLNHMLTIIFLGHVPCSFLVWFQSIHLWACCGTIFSIQEYRHFLWPFELYSPWKKASIHREEGGGGLAKVPGPSPTPVLASLQAALPLHIFRIELILHDSQLRFWNTCLAFSSFLSPWAISLWTCCLACCSFLNPSSILRTIFCLKLSSFLRVPSVSKPSSIWIPSNLQIRTVAMFFSIHFKVCTQDFSRFRTRCCRFFLLELSWKEKKFNKHVGIRRFSFKTGASVEHVIWCTPREASCEVIQVRADGTYKWMSNKSVVSIFNRPSCGTSRAFGWHKARTTLFVPPQLCVILFRFLFNWVNFILDECGFWWKMRLVLMKLVFDEMSRWNWILMKFFFFFRNTFFMKVDVDFFHHTAENHQSHIDETVLVDERGFDERVFSRCSTTSRSVSTSGHLSSPTEMQVRREHCRVVLLDRHGSIWTRQTSMNGGNVVRRGNRLSPLQQDAKEEASQVHRQVVALPQRIRLRNRGIQLSKTSIATTNRANVDGNRLIVRERPLIISWGIDRGACELIDTDLRVTQSDGSHAKSKTYCEQEGHGSEQRSTREVASCLDHTVGNVSEVML